MAKKKDSTKMCEINKEELRLALGRAKNRISDEDYEILENMLKVVDVLTQKVEEDEDEEKIRQFLNQIWTNSE